MLVPGLIGRVVKVTASGVKSWGRCLSAHLQCTVPVLLSAGVPASELDDKIGMRWEGEQ